MTSKASQKTQASVLEDFGHLLNQLRSKSGISEEVQSALVPYMDLIFMPEVERVEQTRLKAAQVAESLARTVGANGAGDLRKVLEFGLRKARQEERSTPIQKLLEQALYVVQA